MLREIRSILFSQQELENAVKLFHNSVQAILPSGKIISFEVAGENEPTLNVNVMAEPEGEMSAVKMGTAHLAAAMLNYCIKNGIPVPRRAKKKIELIEGNLALTLTL
jgi:hypothetical protein